MTLFVDQTCGPLLVDVINEFALSGERVILFCGELKEANIKLNSDVIIIRSSKYRRETSFRRLTSWGSFSINIFFFILFSRRITTVIAVTNPPFVPLITGLLAKWKRLPFYIIIYDLYPDALSQVTGSAKTSLIYKFWSNLNMHFFSRAQRIFTISESMKDAIGFYVDRKIISVIHNWADTDYIRPHNKQTNPFIINHHLHDKKIVLYAGNMGLTHDLESLIEAAAFLRASQDIIFLMIGDGSKKQKLTSLANEKRLSNIIFLPYQEADMFPFAMASADIGIVTLGSGAESISLPSKTYTTMAAGLCLVAIAASASELGTIIREDGVGIVCPPNQPLLLAEIIKNTLEDVPKLSQFKARSLAASKKYNKENAKDYMREVHKIRMKNVSGNY